jgi:hypothetical protein
MLSKRRYKVSTSKKRKRDASSGEGSTHDVSYVPSQSEAASSYASGSYDTDMEDVDMEFHPQVYQGPFKKWTGYSYQKARTVCAYEYEKNSPTPQFWTKVQHDAFYGHLLKKSVFAHKSIDREYVDQYASTRTLKAKFQHVGLLKFTQFTSD